MTPEPVAVVGIGCRYAGGVDSAADLWDLLLSGATTARTVPPERWRAYREHSREHAAALDRVVDRGSFRDDVDGFDAAFFGISAAEAEQLDPQQRIALEVAWEACEDAGIPPPELAGPDTAVYVGVGTDDYGRRLVEDLPRVRAWTGIGASLCGVPNRVSHALDLRGPSVAVDTACSSSLVAVHTACAALRAGEARVALAGGVMIMSGPGLTAVLGEAGAIGPDGRSTPFDASADGYGRGEGCGIVVLKRLSDARADGDDVLAVIRGGAVRQDGRTDGIMAPSEPAQVALMRAAYAAAGVDPATVGYVEAHGTGTPTGDPVEARSLCTVLARPDGEPVCRVGSVKASVGHTEAAAGVAGLIAAVLALRHRRIPATPNPTRPRTDVPWSAANVAPATRTEDWPAPAGHPRRAGVASYGYGGTIAHLVLEEGDPRPGAGRDAAPGTAFMLSAASPAALAAQATRLAAALDGRSTTLDTDSTGSAAPDGRAGGSGGPECRAAGSVARGGRDTEVAAGRPGTADVAVTLAHGRAHLRHRAVVTADGRDGLRAALAALADGGPAADTVTGTAVTGGNAVWVFSGHGAQWPGMGRGLLDTEPEFAAVFDRLAPVYRAELGATPREIVEADELGGVDRIQAALCAVQLGLAAVWRSRGLVPAAVIGHSVGEIAAAVVAGALDEADGARLVCRRSALLPRAAGHGAMVLVDLGFDDCAADLAGVSGVDAAIAAAPSSTVAAGAPDAVAAVAARWEAEGRTVRRVDSDVAFHTSQMQPLADDLAAAVADLRPVPPSVPLYTTALDDPRSDAPRDAGYWAANLRRPVRFADAVAAAAEDGHRTFLEVSAHPVVAHSTTETVGGDALVLGTLRRNRPEGHALDAAAAALHCRGVPVRLRVPDGRRIRLPGVAWQHRPFWVEHRPAAVPGPSHTLLGAPLDVYGPGTRVWRTTLDARTRPYPGSHPVLGTEIVPAAVTLFTYLSAAATTGLSGVELLRPVVVPEDAVELQVVHDGGVLRLASRPPDGDWSAHSAARVDPGDPGPPRLDPDVAADPEDADAVVDRLAELGVAAMGFPWRVDKLRRGSGVLAADVQTDPDGVLRHRDPACLLDAALSVASVVFDGDPVLRMPATIDRVVVDPDAIACAERAVVVAAPAADRPHTVDVELHGGDGTVLARLAGVRYAEPDGGAAEPELAETVFTVRWPETGPDPGGAADPATVVVPGGALADALAAASTTTTETEAGAGAGVTVTARPPVPGPDVRGPVHVLVPISGDPRAAVPALLDALRSAPDRPGTRVWALTRGVRDGTAADGDAAVAGLGRVLRTEHPDRFGGVLDLPGNTVPSGPGATGTSPRPGGAAARAALDPATAAGLLAHLASAGSAEPVVAIDGGRRFTPRAVPLGRGAAPVPSLRPDGTYLVTGGLGAVGSAVAVHLAERGARRIVLLGRTPLPPRDAWDPADPRVRAVLAAEQAGATVVPVAADVTDPDAVGGALAGTGLPPVRGVVHAAGTVRSGPAADVTADDLETVLAAKVDGARALDRLFPPGTLDFLALFSSAGPLLGLPGQAAYAAANGALDGLAARRRAAGDTGCVSIAWTSWRDLGMARAAAATGVELDARGVGDLAPDRALAALDRVLAARHDLDGGPVVVLPVRTGHAGPRPSLLADLATGDEDAPDGAPSWAGLDGPALTAELTALTARCAAAVLGSDDVPAGTPLGELGVDSLLAATLRVRLERATGHPLAPTLLWNHPTVAAIGAHLADVVHPEGERS